MQVVFLARRASLLFPAGIAAHRAPILECVLVNPVLRAPAVALHNECADRTAGPQKEPSDDKLA